MIAVSDNYKTTVDADQRRWIPKVEVYFDGDAQPATVFDGDDVITISPLEESRAESDNPLGTVSANEISITFDNSGRNFTPTNSAGAYYGKLKPNIMVKPYLGLILKASPTPVDANDFCSFSASFPADDWIERIVIVNQGGDTLLDTGVMSAASGGYRDSTGQIIECNPADVLTISVTVSAAGNWDQYLSWGHSISSVDLQKVADLHHSDAVPWTHTYAWEVPNSPGNHLISWWEHYGAYTDGCGAKEYAERQDYTIYISGSPDTVEYIPLGLFRTGEWSAPSNSVEATVTCYDRLHQLGNMDVPMLAMAANTTTGQLFAMLFEGLGLSPGDDVAVPVVEPEFEIDSAVNQVVLLGYVPAGKVLAALQYLAVAGLCNVTCDRYGVIQVKSNFSTGLAVATLTDQDQVISAENPQRYLDAYSAVKVLYKSPRLNELESVLKMDNVVMPTGGVTITEAAFSAAPVAYIEQVQLLGAVNSYVDSVVYGSHTITITIANAGAEETVNIDVLGQNVDYVSSTYTLQNAGAVADYGVKELAIDNNLVQSAAVAATYATSLLSYVSDPLVNFTLEIRGDPSIEVGDVIQVDDPSDIINKVDMVPVRIQMDFDGGLQATVQTRKPIAGV